MMPLVFINAVVVSGENAPLECRGADIHTNYHTNWHRHTQSNPDGILLGSVDSSGNTAHCGKCLFASYLYWPDTMYITEADDTDIGVYSCSLISSDTKSFGHLTVIRKCLH